MGIIFDIIIIIVILLSIYHGYKKGIVNVGFKLFATILSLVVSIALYTPITYFIVNNTQIDETIEKTIIEHAIVNVEKSNNENKGIEEFIQNYAKDIAQGSQNAVVEAAAKPIAVNIVKIGVMIVLYILTRIILIVIKTFTNILTKLPIIKQCNETIGLIYGILRGLIIVYAVLAILYFIASMSGEPLIISIIDSSYITKILYNNNVILKAIP